MRLRCGSGPALRRSWDDLGVVVGVDNEREVHQKDGLFRQEKGDDLMNLILNHEGVSIL